MFRLKNVLLKPYQKAEGVNVVVRQSPDWANIDVEAFKEQSRQFCRTIGRPEDQVNELMALWDSTFAISFFALRQRMKEIAQTNLRSIRNCRTHQIADFKTGDFENQEIFCFVDDDDWFSPEIHTALEAADDGKIEGFRWKHVAFGNKDGEAVTLRAVSPTVYTNNYAVKASYLKSKPANLKSVLQHFDADAAFKKMKIANIDSYLSVTNKHPGSTIFLESNLGEQRTREKLIEVVNQYCDSVSGFDSSSLPREIGWAQAQIEELQGFARDLKMSVK